MRSAPLARRFLLMTSLLYAGSVLAQSRIVEEVRVQTNEDQAVIELLFACEMRFVADTATAGGALLEVRVAPFDSCLGQGLGQGISGKSFTPLGADAAHLLSIEYDSLGQGDSIVLLSFDQPLAYSVRQGASLREVEIVVDLSSPAARQPISSRIVEPESARDYMINLQSTREPVSGEALADWSVASDQILYVSQIRVDGVLWHRLRIGFFGSEGAARLALEPLASRFPRAWIGRAESEEVAEAFQLARGGENELATIAEEGRAAAGGPMAAAGGRAPTQLPIRRAAEPLDPAAAPEAIAHARERMLDGDYAGAIALYARLAETPGEHRVESVEYLGLAYERSGDLARARQAYQRYLREFPSGAGSARVAQRLDSLAAAIEAPRASLREPVAAHGPSWELGAGLAQYYRRDEHQFDEEMPLETTQSALLTDGDFSLRRSGRNVDTQARLSFTQYHDLLDAAEGGRGDWYRIAYAYIDIAENQQQWSLRLGRQSLHSLGVLGRFDGAHFSYGIGRDMRLHFSSGYPVESTRNSVETDRELIGLAIELIDLVGAWDLSAFINRQSFEGVDARQAFGMEARYFDDRKAVTALLDYDADFGEINTVQVLGTLRLHKRVTLSALVDQRRSPILSIRNALIGQPVTSLEEMLIVWTEDEVRDLALDRSPVSRTATLGLATPLGERLQLNFDVTSAEIDASPGSGGVAGYPGTGVQIFYSTSLVATGLMARNDVNIWNLRVGDLANAETKLLTWDGRFPIGRKLRINPRIRFAVWQSLIDGRERQTLSPSLRLLFNGKRYRLELEAGRDEMTRTIQGAERDSSARFINFGYRASI